MIVGGRRDCFKYFVQTCSDNSSRSRSTCNSKLAYMYMLNITTNKKDEVCTVNCLDSIDLALRYM